jgi:hypothetical protein
LDLNCEFEEHHGEGIKPFLIMVAPFALLLRHQPDDRFGVT